MKSGKRKGNRSFSDSTREGVQLTAEKNALQKRGKEEKNPRLTAVWGKVDFKGSFD